jgi:surface antigen
MISSGGCNLESVINERHEKMKTKIIALALVSTLALGACAQQGQPNAWGMGNKQSMGTLGGAVLGGLAGSSMGKGKGQLWTTGAGALLGAFVGSSIGQSLDQADMAYHSQAVERAYTAPLNESVSWDNPQSGHHGTVTPVREGRQASTGNVCRQYKQTIVVDGKAETALGTACKNNSGQWVLSN